MATFELYRRSEIGTCLTETLDEMVQSGTLSPEHAIQILVQFDKVGFRIGAMFFWF
jgi:transcription initiation factor TFIIA small subunit